MTDAIGIYVHLPYCPTKCGYCDFNAYLAPGKDAFYRYTQAVLDEMRLARSREGRSEVATVYFGGGTPSLFPAADVARMLDLLRNLHDVRDDAEISLEANPSGLTTEHLHELNLAGVNRLSIGAQTFSAPLLAAIGRDHGPEDIRRAVAMAEEAGFARLSLDLMYGLPGEADADVEESVTTAIRLGVGHISAYALELEPRTVFGRRHARGHLVLPGEDEVVRRGDLIGARLAGAGFARYEVSNHARPGEECRHNARTWQRRRYRGFGAGAHSFMGETRFWNAAHHLRYAMDVEADRLPVAGREDVSQIARGEWAYLALRTFSLDRQRFEDDFGLAIEEAFRHTIPWALAQGWLSREGSAYVVANERRWLLGQLAARFLEEGVSLDPGGAGLVRSSRLALDPDEC